MMKNINATLLALALFGCGGSLNPCEGTWLGSLTPEQQQNCKDCNSVHDCGDETETGESGLELYCRDDAAGYSAPFCWLAETASAMPVTNPVVVDSADCLSNSFPFPHVPTFATAVRGSYSGTMSQWCARAGEGFDGLHPVTGSEWRVCTNAGGLSTFYNGGNQAYYPAAVVDSDFTKPDQAGWSGRMECQEPSDLSAICDLGLVAVGGQDPSRPHEWTCECEDDWDCQLGAVCEAGWTLEGMFPHPTLCVWDDGTANGAALEGPSVYGLDSWADGIVVEGDVITMTAAMFVSATTDGAGFWDDGQRFEILDLGLDDGIVDIELTACDPEALCGFLGLTEGDVLSAPVDALDLILDGLPVSVGVSGPGTLPRQYVVVVE